tara:strand:- start:751 stop:1587 length:837 start_codon:yes stop_codon:yes gene_type:complete
MLKTSSITALVKNILKEDIKNGDITTRNIFSKKKSGIAEVVARETMILCGLDIFQAVFQTLSSDVKFSFKNYKDGDEVSAENTIIRVECDVVSLLEGERSALNILQWLSGISTLTNMYVKKAKPIKILDTRKTTPGLREFEKYAVNCGGGNNHRFGLYDQVLIKDNHIELAGSITEAVKLIKRKMRKDNIIEVEVKTMEEVEEAIDNNVDIIMLDNMNIEIMKQAINKINGKAKIEISGGVTYERLGEISKLGADFISIGALTHSATAVDISMNITSK